jgi:hypothetical protein
MGLKYPVLGEEPRLARVVLTQSSHTGLCLNVRIAEELIIQRLI